MPPWIESSLAKLFYQHLFPILLNFHQHLFLQKRCSFWIYLSHDANMVIYMYTCHGTLGEGYHARYRPYALTSHLHNNDSMLGVKTCHAARTCCAGRVLALSRCAGPGQPGGMACRGWPAGCMLGDGARDSASFDPQHAGAPFCDVICIRSLGLGKQSLFVEIKLWY